MPTNLETFWTDDVQAQERLLESYVMKQNEIVRVTGVRDGMISYSRASDGMAGRLSMKDPAWNKFRKLPKLGWVNVTLTAPKPVVFAAYLRRSAVRSRTHGLSTANTLVYDFMAQNGDTLNKSRVINASHAFQKGAYNEDKPFPSFEEVYPLLKPKGSIALSSKLALYKDTKGLVTLYRKRKPVGFVTDIKTLLLFSDSTFYREDIQEDADLLPVNIKEL